MAFMSVRASQNSTVMRGYSLVDATALWRDAEGLSCHEELSMPRDYSGTSMMRA